MSALAMFLTAAIAVPGDGPEKVASPPASPVSTAENKSTAVMLRWKFQKGKPFYQIYSTDTSQLMKYMTNDVTQKQSETYYLQWTAEEMANGKWILSQKILGVKVDLDLGGSPIKYDSTAAGDPSNPVEEFFKALIGAELRYSLDASTMEILRIDGREKLAKKLGDAHKGMRWLIDKILSNNALKEMADAAFGMLNGPARPGDSWTKRRREIDMGPVGKFQNTFCCTYEGKGDKLDRITVKITTKYLYPDKLEGSSGPGFHVRKSNLSGNGSGFLYFDRGKGCLDSSLTSVILAGTMEVEIGGQQIQADLIQTQQTTVRTTDTNPIEATLPKKESKPLREETERLRRE